MKTQSWRIMILATMALLLALLACRTGTATPSPTIAVGQQGAEASPAPFEGTSTPTSATATATPAPDVSSGGCTLNAAWVADVTVPDNTQFPPNTAFVKTWRVRNSGTCAWQTGTRLVFISGDAMGGPSAVNVSPTAAGATTNISVNLVAPASPGTYKGNWQMEDPNGVRFGSVIYVQIVVPPSVTPSPTLTPSPTTFPCVAVDPALALIFTQAQELGYNLGCATQQAFSIQGAFQEFWANVDNPNPHTHFRSLMIWRSDNREIYVIDGQDTDASQGALLTYTDLWVEGDAETPPACAAMTVPSGYQLPIRGFGKVWCDHTLVNQVGWPAQHEASVTLLVQPMTAGLLLKVSGPNPAVYSGYLIALDYPNSRAMTRMTSP